MHSAEGMSFGAAAAVTSMQSLPTGSGYDGKIAGLYDLEETLGSGHFAVVKLARHVFTGAKVAVKVVDKTKLDEVSRAHLFQEVRCMKLVQHPNVVRLYEVIDTQTKLYLVLELGDGGDLYDYIMKHEGGLTEDLARKYFRQILRAITYCHQLHVVHRDLKPENVVFFEKLGVVKLTDFGFSNKFSPGQKLETFCGSLAYSAPEILLGDSYDAPAVDIWSLGVILYMLVCGQPPFEKANDSETLTMIMDCKYTVPPQVTQNCKKLISSMLVRDPKKRATLEQIAAHPWLNEKAEFDAGENLPLVSRQQLSDEDHAFVIQKMINGNIASKEEILQALDKNKYNHITATYFLLAELRLRKRREEQNPKKQFQNLVPENTVGRMNCGDIKRDQVPDIKIKPADSIRIGLPPINLAPHVAETKTDKRSRKCSIVREEDEEEPPYESMTDGNELKVAVTRRESISDGRLNRSVQERTNPVTVLPMVEGRPKLVASVDETLAQKLNKIENHAECYMKDKKEVPLEVGVGAVDKSLDIQDTLKELKDLDINKVNPLAGNNSNKNPVLTHRRSKLSKIRTPSCSSSEASDDDTKARNKKKINKFVGDTPARFRMHRRDSHDDSSDSQDQTYPSSGSQQQQQQTAQIISGNNSNVSEKKDGQKQGKDNKSEESRKNSHSHSQQKHKKQPKDSSMDKGSRASMKSDQSMFGLGRRRVRESQSLDRITEAQEYELRHRCLAMDSSHIGLRNSFVNLNSFSVAETKEEYDTDEGIANGECEQQIAKSNILDTENSLHIKNNNNNSNNNMSKLNSIEEIDLILEEKTLAKSIQMTGSKCFVTMKKIRKLGKYFPVVNFS